jgi:hypothetical protein
MHTPLTEHDIEPMTLLFERYKTAWSLKPFCFNWSENRFHICKMINYVLEWKNVSDYCN